MSTQLIKELRELTGAGIMSCKKALETAQGDFKVALEILKQQGHAKAQKKADRETRQGLIETYIHTGGRIGAMVELNCETDFVANTDQFKELAHNLAMQVAATDPKFLSEEELSGAACSEELIPAEVCLLRQPFIKNPEMTVHDLVVDTVARTGENIKIRRFARFELSKD